MQMNFPKEEKGENLKAALTKFGITVQILI